MQPITQALTLCAQFLTVQCTEPLVQALTNQLSLTNASGCQPLLGLSYSSLLKSPPDTYTGHFVLPIPGKYLKQFPLDASGMTLNQLMTRIFVGYWCPSALWVALPLPPIQSLKQIG